MKTSAFGIIALSLTVAATSALAFGTIRTLGQDAEHERITRHALACEKGSATDTCFEPNTLDIIAGKTGSFGAVGIPDSGTMIFEPKTHCDRGDYLDVPGYPQSLADANAHLAECRTWMAEKLAEAVKDAGALVDESGKIKSSEIPGMIPCFFAGTKKGRAKCNVLEDFGILLHAAQDFYAHTNWTDRADSKRPVSPDNPPGLGNEGRSPWLDLRKPASPVPAGLISGCFETLPEDSHCNYGSDGKLKRVKHMWLNKDEGTIDPKLGEGRTSRGKVEGNFARAVNGAILDSRDKWATLREQLIATYGDKRGTKMICALTRDDPECDC